MKTLFSLAALLFFGGCSYFKVSGTMCEQAAADPSRPVPQECRDYDEAAAEKASLPKKTGECPECSEPEKLEYRP